MEDFLTHIKTLKPRGKFDVMQTLDEFIHIDHLHGCKRSKARIRYLEEYKLTSTDLVKAAGPHGDIQGVIKLLEGKKRNNVFNLMVGYIIRLIPKKKRESEPGIYRCTAQNK